MPEASAEVLLRAGTNTLVEYELHNLSDADFTYSGPAVGIDNVILQTLASEFGFSPADPNYFLGFRNPVLSFFTAERLEILYADKGINAVRKARQRRDLAIKPRPCGLWRRRRWHGLQDRAASSG